MSAEEHIPLLFQTLNLLSFHTRLIDQLSIILFILGISGNLFGLAIFSSSCRYQPISPTYVYLATSSSITNFFCIVRYAAMLNSNSRMLLRRLVGQSWWACKSFEVSFSFRIIASWITLFWMFERLICVCGRFRKILERSNTRKYHFLIPIFMLTFVLGWTMGPPLYFYQPYILLNDYTTNMSRFYCDVDPNSSRKWRDYFHTVQFGLNHFTVRCLFSEIIPTVMVVLFNICIIVRILRSCHRLYRNHYHQPYEQQIRTTSWMNMVLIFHSLLFLTSLAAHIVGHLVHTDAHETWWVALAVLTNCSLNFYVYCLSGRAFRKEIRRFITSMTRSSLA